MPFSHRVHERCGCHAEAGAASRPFAFPGTQRHFEPDRPFSVDHLRLDIDIDVDGKKIAATARLRVRRVDPTSTEMPLDAIGFAIEKVTLDGEKTAYVYDGRQLKVTIPSDKDGGEVAIAYRASPRRGMYFLAPDEHVTDRPRQVWTQFQEEDARHVLPCHDKPHVKMTTEMVVTVPSGFTVLSNGALVDRDTSEKAEKWRWHWRMEDPHPSYLLTIVVGEFEELEDKVGDVPLTYLVPRGRAADGKRTFARTPDMIAYFGEVTGTPYPWNKYAQVVVSDFIFGGMENTTATTMYEHILLDERAQIDITSDDLIAHELAHQWFGDYVTCRDWSEGWLNEGFATFMEHVWREKLEGRDEYDVGVKVDLDAYLSEASGRYRRAIVTQAYDAPLDLFDRHLYEKGGLVLHLLRRELGDTLFWKGINRYLTRHARGVVETRDLMRALEEVSGKSLGRFFDQWVFRPGHPEMEVDVSWDKGVLTVSTRQSQSTADEVPAVFELCLELDIVTGGKTRREKVTVTQKSESFTIPQENRPDFVVVDPDMRVLGDVSLKVPNDMLRRQLATATTARGRWLAANALAKSDDPVTIEALAARLADGAEMWAVRAACAEALGALRAREAFAALSANIGVEHAKVRRAVVAALGRFKTTAAMELLKPRALRDASYLVEAEAARSLGKTRQSQALETLVDLLDRTSWSDVVRVGAIDGLAALRDDRAIPHLQSRLRYGHPTRARRASILALPKLSSDRRAREALEDLLDDSDPHLRIDVARALGEMADVKARGALRARLETDLDPRVRRRLRETLRDLGGESKRAVDQVKDELDKVLNEHAELKARLAKLEARVGDRSGSHKPPTPPSAARPPATKKAKKGAKR